MKPSLIPDRLIKARESLNLNKSQAAELLGLTPIGYLRYEQGLRTPSIQMLQLIALSFHTSVAYLCGEIEDQTADLLLLRRGENPYLFELADDLQTKEMNQAKRLLEYYKKMNKS